ncbi:MAG TPA: bifunctional 2-polyprenyl-6-hydroxyphenol methylase/3-demethylubiquinol 3-O-methyltransferase UbiG [Polyangiaceae bacterium]|nr:bifunctional 2-polyprenyl-6-hydroxyphenol methylase/3-demethylubiquinol 3-O-methyltransferase UbiG [Polyangiaceae bacterium]
MEANLTRPLVNDDFHGTLGERWYDAEEAPVAFLRAESRLRNPWIAQTIAARFPGRACAVLDVGCGAGFLANYLSGLGHLVTGLDTAEASLRVAHAHDTSGKVDYRLGDALALPFGPAAFDVVCAVDVLDHVEAPALLVSEASRVLAAGGLFFFHTFNRNLLSWLVVIKGVEWFVKDTPLHLHVLRLFSTPEELRRACNAAGLEIMELFGTRPKLDMAFARMLKSGMVPREFAFTRTRSTRLAYTGFARKGVA